MKKFYVFRIVNHNGRKEYKRCKCVDSWVKDKTYCWKFSKQGAKSIVDTYNAHSHGFYSYGFEEA